MGTNTLLTITWVTVAGLLIALGLYWGRRQAMQDAQRSLIFQPGHEEYADAYHAAIYRVEQEWKERQRI